MWLGVTEGYKSPPASHAFTHSVTTIFVSANDINQDVFGSPHHLPSRTGLTDTHHKRSRPADHGSDPKLDMDNDRCDMVINVIPKPTPSQDRADRIIRKHRSILKTQSLPAGALCFSHQPVNPPTTVPITEAEEDWSVRLTDNMNMNQSPFTPVIFDWSNFAFDDLRSITNLTCREKDPFLHLKVRIKGILRWMTCHCVSRGIATDGCRRHESPAPCYQTT